MLSTPASHSMAVESIAVVPVAMPALRTALYTSFCAELRYAYKLYISSAPEEKNFDEVTGRFDVSTATDGSKWVNSALPSHISPCFGALRAKAPTEAQESSIRNAKNTETVFFIFNTLCKNDFSYFLSRKPESSSINAFTSLKCLYTDAKRTYATSSISFSFSITSSPTRTEVTSRSREF